MKHTHPLIKHKIVLNEVTKTQIHHLKTNQTLIKLKNRDQISKKELDST